MKKNKTIILCLLFALSLVNLSAQVKQVLYVNQTGVDPGDDGSEPNNDAVIRMLNSDENFEVTYIETPQDGSNIPDLSTYDLIVAQENISSGAVLLKPEGILSIKNVTVPIIYCKSSAFRDGKAVSDADASATSTQNLFLTVPTANQDHELFSGIDFADQEEIQITYNLTNSSGSDPGSKAMEIVNDLEISTTGTLLGTVPEVTNADKAIVVNFLPSGTQLGESEIDVLKVDAITLSFGYGPLVYQDGTNISNNGLTIWRNAAYILTGLEVPTESYFNPALTKKILYINQTGFSNDTGSAADPGYDPIIRMLEFEEYFEVTYIETPKDGSNIPDLSQYDLVIAQETLESDGALFKPGGKLGINEVSIPIIYNKSGSFTNTNAVSDSDAALTKTQNLSVTVDPANQSHSLFNGIDFSQGNTVNVFSSTAGSDGSDIGDEAIDIVNNLNITTNGSLLASVPEVTNEDQAIVINYLPAGTQLGDSNLDVLNVNAVALSFNYGAIAKQNGTNITNEGITIWRNAAYLLTDLPVPADLCSNPALTKQVLYLNQKGVDPGNGGGSQPANDPIIRMLDSDPNFKVTYIETYSGGDQIPDPKLYDLVIAQETLSSGATFFKPGGVLSVKDITTPIIYNKPATFRNERAITDTDISLVNTTNLSLEVSVINQSHDLFKGIDFNGGNNIQFFKSTAANDGSLGGDKAMDIINNLNISDTGTLLATVPEVTNQEQALVVNYFPAGTQLGEASTDVLSENAFAFAFSYGALVAGDGENISSEGLTIWRNAAYILTGLEIPDYLYINENYVLNINEPAQILLPISCSPNPTTEKINLKIETGIQEVFVSLYNLNGQKLYENNLVVKDNSLTIDLSSFETGIYILKARSGLASNTIKIIKQ